jgi:hypothetical protein
MDGLPDPFFCGSSAHAFFVVFRKIIWYHWDRKGVVSSIIDLKINSLTGN